MARVLIVGGVAGGATAAARLRRMDEGAEIVLFERGDYISYANCGLPYYIGGAIAERERLFVQTPQGFSKRFKVDVRTGSEVVRILPDKKQVEVKERKSGKTYTERYDKLVLSPGCRADQARHPGDFPPRDLHPEERSRHGPDQGVHRQTGSPQGAHRGGGFHRSRNGREPRTGSGSW